MINIKLRRKTLEVIINQNPFVCTSELLNDLRFVKINSRGEN